MSFFTKPLRPVDLQPLTGKTVYIRISLGWMTEHPYTYCGVADELQALPGKKGLAAAFVLQAKWIIETRDVVNVRSTSDERIARPLRRSIRYGTVIDIHEPYRKDEHGTLVIFNNQDRIELAACGEPEVFVKRILSEYNRI
jgi:hypothetical protein